MKMMKKRPPELDIGALADLARINLSEAEKKNFPKELAAFLSYVDLLDKLKTGRVSETAQIGEQRNVFSPDEQRPCLTEDEVTSGAFSTEDGYFSVQAVFQPFDELDDR